jgi:hypothetical protein
MSSAEGHNRAAVASLQHGNFESRRPAAFPFVCCVLLSVLACLARRASPPDAGLRAGK